MLHSYTFWIASILFVTICCKSIHFTHFWSIFKFFQMLCLSYYFQARIRTLFLSWFVWVEMTWDEDESKFLIWRKQFSWLIQILFVRNGTRLLVPEDVYPLQNCYWKLACWLIINFKYVRTWPKMVQNWVSLKRTFQVPGNQFFSASTGRQLLWVFPIESIGKLLRGTS